MDEGSNGTYTLSSDNENVLISPESGSEVTPITVTLIASSDFDYETQGDQPVIVTIMATEYADPDHQSTSQLQIQLLDINDNRPEFEKDPYEASLNETDEFGYSVLTVVATDDDISDSFNTNTIVYSLTGCTEFAVDSQTGEIISTQPLNYETKQGVNCTITASDMYGSSSESLDSKTTFIATILDLNDEPPVFVNFASVDISIPEDTSPGYILTDICVVDVDTNAALSVILEFPGSLPEVEQWFDLIPVVNNECSSAEFSYYSGQIVVADSMDREYQKTVNILIIATDDATEVNSAETTESLTVTLLDVNDEAPYFDDPNKYTDLDVEEELTEGTLVIIVVAYDDDEDDVLTYSVSDNTYLDINSTGALYVNSRIDREEISEFSLEVIVEDAVGHITTLPINANVGDINDNPPEINDDICSTPYEVLENASEGTFIVQVEATDADQGIHQDISYQLNNQGYSTAPFSIDSSTGEVKVHYEDGEDLDREKASQWQLPIVAYDHCGTSEYDCTVLRDTCELSITVLDVNDNPPSSLYPSYVSTDESIEQGEFISDERFYSHDPDEVNSPNSRIEFKVNKMYDSDGEMQDLLVEAATYSEMVAEELQYYCQFHAAVDLAHLMGVYVIEVQAQDYGEPQLTSFSNVTLQINDYNDYYPTFYFDNCDNRTIVQQENDEDMVNVPLQCESQLEPLEIYIYDEDGINNNQISLRINYENSTSNYGEGNQLTSFEVFRQSENLFNIICNQVLDRERGSAYNLSLEARDNGLPPLVSYSWVLVKVLDADEYPPVFCQPGSDPCTDLLQMIENSQDGSFFQTAYDKDNSLLEEGSSPQLIGYQILDQGPIEVFYIPNETVNYIAPLSPEGLDREQQGLYSNIQIGAYPYEFSGVTPIDASILNVAILVIDENDNWPYYPEEAIYGDYLDTGNAGDRVAIFKFEDADLNDELTYKIMDDFVWSDNASNYEQPFAIRQYEGNNTAEIYLNMDPEGTTGYCTFTVSAKDLASHTNTTKALIFVVTKDYLVQFYFENSLDEVRELKDEIEEILSSTFRATCVTDSIVTATNENNEPINYQTQLEAHFFREVEVRASTRLELVPTVEIERIASDSRVAKYLLESLESIGLSLVSIGDSNSGALEENNDEETIQALSITLVTVTLVLGFILLLVFLTYFVKVRKLRLQLKAAETPVYAASNAQMKEELDPSFGTVSAPKTNNNFTFGRINPIYNRQFYQKDDLQEETQSHSSGDSNMVGVEETPYFKDFQKIEDNYNNEQQPHRDTTEYKVTEHSDSAPSNYFVPTEDTSDYNSEALDF